MNHVAHSWLSSSKGVSDEPIRFFYHGSICYQSSTNWWFQIYASAVTYVHVLVMRCTPWKGTKMSHLVRCRARRYMYVDRRRCLRQVQLMYIKWKVFCRSLIWTVFISGFWYTGIRRWLPSRSRNYDTEKLSERQRRFRSRDKIWEMAALNPVDFDI